MTLSKKLFWILFFFPIFVTSYFAWLFFIDLPLTDYWDVLWRVPQLEGSSPTEMLKYLWAPFVDQKMVFSKFFIHYLATHTQNSHYGLEIMLGLAGQGLVLLLLSYLLWKTPDLEKGRKQLLLLTFSWFLFWPNILVRFQHHWYSTQYTFVLVFALSSIFACVYFRGMWLGVILSLLFAICSAVSHGTGLIYLLCYGVALVFVTGWTKYQKAAVAIIVGSVIAVIASQIPPRETMNMPPLNWFTDNPLQELVFMFRCFGPDGVLRAQTGFLTLALGLFSSWRLLKRKKLLDGDYFAWLLIFFWGGSVAFLSGVTRSAVSSSPFRVYFYFFVVVLIAVIVLCAIVWPGDSFKRKKKSWKFVILVLYLVGCADGIHDATKIYRRNVATQEKLQLQPVLIDSDYQDLFPYPRIKTIVNDLHEQGMLDLVDTRALQQKADIRFSSHMKENELYFTPDRPIMPGEVVAFSEQTYKQRAAKCYWNFGSDWKTKQVQELQLRPVDGSYWVLFINRNLPRHGKKVTAIKLHFQEGITAKEALGLPAPTVWSRE